MLQQAKVVLTAAQELGTAIHANPCNELERQLAGERQAEVAMLLFTAKFLEDHSRQLLDAVKQLHSEGEDDPVDQTDSCLPS